MALKDLLAHVDSTPHSLKRLHLAGDLARRHGSRLTVFYAREWSPAQLESRKTAELGLASASDLANLDQQIEASLDHAFAATRTAVEATARECGIQADYWIADGPAGVFLPQKARFADLCVVSHSLAARQDIENYSLAEKLLFTSGRPVLSIPEDGSSSTTLGAHVAVAWNSSRPAARSVNDAMPLIERADRVTVVTVNPADHLRPGALPAAQLLEHFRRHGAEPDLVEVDGVPPHAIGDTLQTKARDVGADVLVAGAFGHPQLWERLLGGVTLDILGRLQLPVLMSY